MQELKYYFLLLDSLCATEAYFTDEELADELRKLYKMIPDNIETYHPKSGAIIKRRVEQYCKINNIDKSEYKGPLPYRLFTIGVHKNLKTEEDIHRYVNKVIERIKKWKKRKF